MYRSPLGRLRRPDRGQHDPFVAPMLTQPRGGVGPTEVVAPRSRGGLKGEAAGMGLEQHRLEQATEIVGARSPIVEFRLGS